MALSTILWIEKSGNDWICPPFEVGSSEFYKNEDKYNVLDWGEWQADLYTKATKRVKFPALAGANEIARGVRVQLGEKAVARLSLSPIGRNNSHLMNVYNIRFVNVKGRGENYGIYFGYVFANGEFASVCTQLVNSVHSSPTQSTMSWSNANVLKYKREFNYPENPFMNKKSEDAPSLAPAIPDLSGAGISAKDLEKSFKEMYTISSNDEIWIGGSIVPASPYSGHVSNTGRFIIDDPTPTLDAAAEQELREQTERFLNEHTQLTPLILTEWIDDMEDDNYNDSED